MELMSPIDALFLSAESREHPLHVGALQLFEPPAGAGRGFVRETYQAMLQCREIAPLFRKRPTSLHGALINLGWSTDADVDLGYHARRSALPAPGRVRELLELTSRLHSNLLDRHRPLWETHVIEGLRDGRFAIYSKMHHALVDGVSGLTLMRQPMTTDPIEGKLRTAWSPATQHTAIKRRRGRLQQLGGMLGSVAGLAPSTLRLARSALIEQQLTLPSGPAHHAQCRRRGSAALRRAVLAVGPGQGGERRGRGQPQRRGAGDVRRRTSRISGRQRRAAGHAAGCDGSGEPAHRPRLGRRQHGRGGVV